METRGPARSNCHSLEGIEGHAHKKYRRQVVTGSFGDLWGLSGTMTPVFSARQPVASCLASFHEDEDLPQANGWGN